MKFDVLSVREACGKKIEYGILRGEGGTVFIKAGRGGTHRGENDKYLRFAAYLREKYGVGVICADNPDECRSSCAEDIDVLHEYACGRVYLWGTSDGAFKCIDIALALGDFEKAVLVNMPLMINFYRTKERLRALGGSHFAFVYGERDPSFKYLPFISSLEGSETKTLSGSGHVLPLTAEECELFARLLFNSAEL